MEHIKTFESFTNDMELNEGLGDMFAKVKQSVSGWVDKKLAEVTQKQIDVIQKNPKLLQLVSELQKQMAESPKDAAILKGIAQDPNKLANALKEQGGDLNESMIAEGLNVKDVINKALKVLGISTAIIATLAAIVGGIMIGGAGFLLTGFGVLAAAILLASLPKPIEIPGIMTTTTK